MPNRKKVLVCPLNWGLGHASRDIPIIKQLQENSFEVILAADGDAFELLAKEFSGLNILKLPGYRVRYSKSGNSVLKMLLLIPKIFLSTIKELISLKKIVKLHNIDIVISDNRFGLWNKSTYNIFITHQLRVKFPGILKRFEFIYKALSFKFISKYDECWIPDFEGEINISGELSHLKKSPKNVKFIGPLSRFGRQNCLENKLDHDIAFILSGPEPQRLILEEIIYNQTKETDLKCVLVRGSLTQQKYKFNFSTFDILNSEDLEKLICKTETVVCRSGYSSVMDLIALRKKAILIPTPGQTEQEYLAKYLMEKSWFYSVNQTDFNLKNDLQSTYQAPNLNYDQKSLLDNLINSLKER